jgi:hypothetical protein
MIPLFVIKENSIPKSGIIGIIKGKDNLMYFYTKLINTRFNMGNNIIIN